MTSSPGSGPDPLGVLCPVMVAVALLTIVLGVGIYLLLDDSVVGIASPPSGHRPAHDSVGAEDDRPQPGRLPRAHVDPGRARPHLQPLRARGLNAAALGSRFCPGREFDLLDHDSPRSIGGHADPSAVRESGLEECALRNRHPPPLVDHRLAALPGLSLVVGRLHGRGRCEWGRQESNLRRQSLTVYSRRPLTSWILPRARRIFSRRRLAVNELH